MKYLQSLHGLINAGKADQLAASHRQVLVWINTLENVLSEQQRILMKQGGNLDKNKIGFYILSLPSDQLATLCVVHVMRNIMGMFVRDRGQEKAQEAISDFKL